MVELITSLLQYAGISVTCLHPPHGLHRICSANFVSRFLVLCFLFIFLRVAANRVVNTIIKLALMTELLITLYISS